MRFGGPLRIGLLLVAIAVVGQSVWAALTGEGWFTESDYSTSGRVAQALLAIGLGVVFVATLRVMHRTDKTLREARERVEERRKMQEEREEAAPTIDYREGD